MPPEQGQRPFTDVLDHPDLVVIYQRWRGLGPGYRRKAMTPDLFKEFLPNFFLMDVVRPAIRFRYRLMGTEIDAHVGQSLTGRFMDEVRTGQTLRDLTRLFTASALEGVPGYYKSRLETETRPLVTYHRLSLPLYDDDGVVRVLMGGWYAVYEPGVSGTLLEFQSDGAADTAVALDTGPPAEGAQA